MESVILKGSSTDEMQTQINEYLSAGFKPVGGTSVASHVGAIIYIQLMIKEKNNV